MGMLQRCGVGGAICALVATLLVPGPASAHEIPRPDPDKLQVISLGDSYIAGQGVGNYYPNQGPDFADRTGPAVPDAHGTRNCYQSYSSYPWQYVQMLNEAGSPAEVWHSACAGAHVLDIADPRDPHRESQWRDHVPEQWKAEADIILVSAGGNDVGFAELARHCQINHQFGPDCQGLIFDAWDAIVPAMEDLELTLQQVAEDAPRADIVVVGYPDLNSPVCLNAAGEEQMATLHEMHETILTSMTNRLNLEVADRFHSIRPRSSGEFDGRGPCAARWAKLIRGHEWFGNEAWHPNINGATTYATMFIEADFHRGLPLLAEPPEDPNSLVQLVVRSGGSWADYNLSAAAGAEGVRLVGTPAFTDRGVFVVGNDGRLRQFVNGVNGWQVYEIRPDLRFAGGVTATTSGEWTNVFATSSSGSLVQLVVRSGGSWADYNLSAAAGAEGVRLVGTPAFTDRGVFVVGNDGRLRQFVNGVNGWQVYEIRPDLRFAGGVTATTSGEWTNVFATSSSGSLVQLVVRSGGSWADYNLSAAAGAEGVRLVGTPAFTDRGVFVVGNDGRLRQFVNGVNGWQVYEIRPDLRFAGGVTATTSGEWTNVFATGR